MTMAYRTCEHCDLKVKVEEGVLRDGFSYHLQCHKCYACSDTELHDAEIFKGVIFCRSCSRRIFQNCTDARRTRALRHNKRYCNRTKAKPSNYQRISVINRVLALADAHEDSDCKTESDTMEEDSNIMTANVLLETPMSQGHTADHFVKGTQSPERGIVTEITQEMLDNFIKSLTQDFYDSSPTNTMSPFKIIDSLTIPAIGKKRAAAKAIASDTRMAHLGASTEIANTAMSNVSQKKTKPKQSEISQHNRKESIISQMGKNPTSSDVTDDSSYVNTRRRNNLSLSGRNIGSILKFPVIFFKKNIMKRSSLVKTLESENEYDYFDFSVKDRIKMLFSNDIPRHQKRGVRRLYSTIYRRQTRYRLGWLTMPKTVVTRDEEGAPKLCKHFERSHSYRCMRNHTMSHAGPTKSELAVIRKKIRHVFVPKKLRKLMDYRSYENPMRRNPQVYSSLRRTKVNQTKCLPHMRGIKSYVSMETLKATRSSDRGSEALRFTHSLTPTLKLVKSQTGKLVETQYSPNALVKVKRNSQSIRRYTIESKRILN